MKITIRMLRIATLLLWIVIIFFSITAVYSVMNLKVTIGDVNMLPSSRGINFSLPFSIINDGYYEITDLNITTRVTDTAGTLIDLTKTIIPSIPKNTSVDSSHTIEIEIDNILSIDHLNLLLNDSEFDVEIFAGLNFAGAVPVQLSLNTTIPWGAPFAQFTLGEINISPHNNTHVQATIPVSFENHAVLDTYGTLKLEVYDGSQNIISAGVTSISVPSEQIFSDSISLFVTQENALKLSNTESYHIIFETPMFSVDWWETCG